MIFEVLFELFSINVGLFVLTEEIRDCAFTKHPGCQMVSVAPNSEESILRKCYIRTQGCEPVIC